MEAPINIVVEWPDGEKAELVGRAIAQGLKDNYGFEQVLHAHIVADSPGFRAWKMQVEDVEEQSLLQAMVAHNPGIMQTPVTVLTRQADDAAAVDLGSLPRLADKPNVISLGGIGETGVTAEELQNFATAGTPEEMRDKAWEQAKPELMEKAREFAQEVEQLFDGISNK